MVVRLCPWMDSMSQRARDGGETNVQEVRAENCSCIFRTPHIRVGRMSQGARDGGAANV